MGYDYTLKTIIIGDACVGKSSLLRRLIDDTFAKNYISTIGVDFRIKKIEIKKKIVKVQIWDTAGQERFRSIIRSYYKDADIILICYDVTNKETYNNVKKWVDDAHNFGNSKHIIIIGNKLDLRKTYEPFENQYDYPHYETSAKTDNTIINIFNNVVHDYIIEIIDRGNELGAIDFADLNIATYDDKCCRI